MGDGESQGEIERQWRWRIPKRQEGKKDRKMRRQKKRKDRGNRRAPSIDTRIPQHQSINIHRDMTNLLDGEYGLSFEPVWQVWPLRDDHDAHMRRELKKNLELLESGGAERQPFPRPSSNLEDDPPPRTSCIMQKTFMRVPYTGALPPPRIVPSTANTSSGAIAALSDFLTAPPSTSLKPQNHDNVTSGSKAPPSTVILSGAGLSVASGLADYRGSSGTYTLNRTYRPIYFNEFVHNHEARKRYWARSFLGWTNLHKARPNAAHWAVKELGELGFVKSVITQNVDSFHPTAHPLLPTLELHGYLRSLVCLTCGTHLPRSEFQTSLSTLNPAWATFLAEALASGALDTENPAERRAKGMKTNPDGDVDLPGAPYSTFRYPACPTCLSGHPGSASPGHRVDVDTDGAWLPTSTAGILKPAVIMFGESIPSAVKTGAENLIDEASRLLVVGSSLATYSAWRLVRRAQERGMPLGILNLGGVRGEGEFFKPEHGVGRVRVEMKADEVLPSVVEQLKGR
ncbi:MAG: DNA-directed RNA polymerases I II and III subunit RPABC2 [Chaenotheca gracillima]|nr:MAG: DNA-directed RNA polymerases I II and III subunit RPABC2 [Chaenotheca gracillima]